MQKLQKIQLLKLPALRKINIKAPTDSAGAFLFQKQNIPVSDCAESHFKGIFCTVQKCHSLSECGFLPLMVVYAEMIILRMGKFSEK